MAPADPNAVDRDFKLSVHGEKIDLDNDLNDSSFFDD